MRKSYSYKPQGVCSKEIFFDIEDGKVYNIRFVFGCGGNTKGVAALCEGMTVDEVIKRLKGIDCGGRGTSCPDQLATGLIQALESEKNAS